MKRPIVIDVTQSSTTAGVDLNGAKVVAYFNDPNRSALTIRIPADRKGIAFRGLKIFNGSLITVNQRNGSTCFDQKFCGCSSDSVAATCNNSHLAIEPKAVE